MARVKKTSRTTNKKGTIEGDSVSATSKPASTKIRVGAKPPQASKPKQAKQKPSQSQPNEAVSAGAMVTFTPSTKGPGHSSQSQLEASRRVQSAKDASFQALNLANQIVCPDCGSTDIIDEEKSGNSVCNECGIVVEENAIVSSIEFSESGGNSQVIGQFVSGTSSKAYSNSGLRRGGDTVAPVIRESIRCLGVRRRFNKLQLSST